MAYRKFKKFRKNFKRKGRTRRQKTYFVSRGGIRL